MRGLVVLLCFLLVACSKNDTIAFGTYEKMTPEELKSKGVILTRVDQSDEYTSSNAPTLDKRFVEYKYTFKDNKLCAVEAITNQIKNQSKEEAILNEINFVKSDIEKKYGSGQLLGISDKDTGKDNVNTASKNSNFIYYFYYWDEKMLGDKRDFDFISIMPAKSENNILNLRVVYLFKGGCKQVN